MQGANQNEEDNPIRSLGHNALVELLNNNNSDRGSEPGEDTQKGGKEAPQTYSFEGDTLRRKRKASKGKKRTHGKAEKKRAHKLPTRKSIKQSSYRDINEEDTKMLKHPHPRFDTPGKTNRERNKSYLRMMSKYNLFFGNGKKPHFVMPPSDHMMVRGNIPVGGFHRRSGTTIKGDISGDATDDADDDDDAQHDGEKRDKFFFLKKSNVRGEIMDGARVPMLGGFSPEGEMKRDGRGSVSSGGESGGSPGGAPSEKRSENLTEKRRVKSSDASPDAENTPDMLKKGEEKKESTCTAMPCDVKRHSSTGSTHLGERSHINESHKKIGSDKASRKRRNKKDSDAERKKLHKPWCDIDSADSIEKEVTLTSPHSSSVKNESNKKPVVMIQPDDRLDEVEKVSPPQTPAVVGKIDFQTDLAKVVKIEGKDSPHLQTALRRNEGDMDSLDLDDQPPTGSISQVDPFNHEDFIFLDFNPVKEEYVEIKKTLERYKKKRELTEERGDKMHLNSNGQVILEKKMVKEILTDKKEKQSGHQNDENGYIKKNLNQLKEKMRRGKIRIISYDFVRNLCYILVRGDSSL
ncbi:conserved Plasmodium protein, unknown function [Plasmodium vivax]|uniref:Uncharacterized protein n=2 Tax=Plasmodium vivax TaxID=5855 RepID=A5K5A6_PLAVS|nr:hypothetical protein, conserved [Plasmodium vivax]EDL45834.1 hypothetical protein, conserved [Plasmodium vivax]KMZ86586.1 hypothetical protein PVBG_04745 [Plasmodium vivax Brazil I]CAI7720732.1 conserved Plasmodium protein, unknown function [Plasmodium vivax]|eukprot:XP_001615561.1 hypothetical protein [Plasmodium vivax Sal-1]